MKIKINGSFHYTVKWGGGGACALERHASGVKDQSPLAYALDGMEALILATACNMSGNELRVAVRTAVEAIFHNLEDVEDKLLVDGTEYHQYRNSYASIVVLLDWMIAYEVPILIRTNLLLQGLDVEAVVQDIYAPHATNIIDRLESQGLWPTPRCLT